VDCQTGYPWQITDRTSSRQHGLAAEPPLRGGRLAGGSGPVALVQSTVVRAWSASEKEALASPSVGCARDDP
jgi:hypothetical protein